MKRWYLSGSPGIAYLLANSLVREHHWIDLPANLHLVAIHFSGAGEMEKFEANTGAVSLGHVMANPTLPTAAVTALAAFGVVSTDGIRDALVKILSSTKMYQLVLGEF